MRQILAILFCLILTSCVVRQPSTLERATATQLPGQDILSLPMQDIDMIKANLQPGQCIGVMAGTFGQVKRPLEELLATGKVPCFRTHLGGFCSHGSRCTDGECKPTDFNCLKSRARAAEKTALAFPNSKCYASPYAEYSSTNRTQVNEWFKIIKEHAPSCTPVASAFGGYVPPNVLVEKHGNSPGITDITSNDGSNYFDSDSVKYNKIARIISFKWTNRYNLRLTSEKSAPPPPKERSLSNRIEKHDFLLMQIMQQALPPEPPAPGVCKSIRRFSGQELWKPHSEDYGVNNGVRGNRPMLISKRRISKFDVVNKAGKVIACLKYYGTFTAPGYYRYYMGTCSGENAYDLYLETGEWAFLKDGGVCTPITVIRRMNYFRE